MELSKAYIRPVTGRLSQEVFAWASVSTHFAQPNLGVEDAPVNPALPLQGFHVLQVGRW